MPWRVRSRDDKYTAASGGIIASAGVQVRRLPPRSPDLNALAEQWAKAAQAEALDPFILFHERQVRRVLTE